MHDKMHVTLGRWKKHDKMRNWDILLNAQSDVVKCTPKCDIGEVLLNAQSDIGKCTPKCNFGKCY
jgi:hypothetical protein